MFTLRRLTMKAIVTITVIIMLLAGGRVHAAPTWTSCTPVQIVTYTSRVHVRCAAAVGGITFFATSTENAANAARMLSVITSAQIAGRTLTILYDPADMSGAAIGCLASDCRLIQAVGFGQ
jgi:hypothetical protein